MFFYDEIVQSVQHGLLLAIINLSKSLEIKITQQVYYYYMSYW